MATQNYLEDDAGRNASWLRNIDDNFSSRHDDIFTDDTVEWEVNESGFTSSQVDMIRSSVDELDSIIETDFTETTSDADTNDADGVLDISDQSLDGNTIGLAQGGTGDLLLDSDDISDADQFKEAALHELGHAAGLSHPADEDEAFKWGGTEPDGGTGFHVWGNNGAGTGPDGNSNVSGTLMEGSVSGAFTSYAGIDVQTLRYLHGNETDDMTSVSTSSSSPDVTVNNGDELDVALDDSSNTVTVKDDGETFINGVGAGGNDEVVLEGETEEFVFKQTGNTLNVYDDDGLAAEMAVNGTFDLTFSKVDGTNDGNAGSATFGTMEVKLGSFDGDSNPDISVGGIDISNNGRVFDTQDAVFV